MWARALIMGLSLIAYIIVAFFTIRSWYKDDFSEFGEKAAKTKIKGYIMFWATILAIVLSFFIFALQSYIFLSATKMIICLGILYASILTMLVLFYNKRGLINTFLMLIFCVFFVLGFIIISAITINNTHICTKEDVSVQIIEPTMFSENKIGYTCDNEGNIEKYFYYYNDNGELKYKEFAGLEVEVIEINNEDTYVEKITKTSEWVNTDKKPSASDYTYENTEEEYVLYINYNQAIKISN